MSYFCEHPAMGALKGYNSPAEVLQIREAIFHAVLLAACEYLHQNSPELSDALSFAALEYRDAVHYVIDPPEARDEKEMHLPNQS
jgi:hypothetical protein